MAKHSELTNVHIPYAWEYDDATEREAATGFVTADVGKLARQLDDNSLWMLTDDSPETWVSITGEGFIPTHYDLPFLNPDSNTSFSTVGSPDTQGHALLSAGTLNNEAVWNIDLPAGTYRIHVYHSKAINRGIYHVYFDATDVGNFDGYNGSTTFVVNTITGITVTGGTTAIKIKMEAKNGSSSDYFGVIYGIYLVKTG
jgi:hypothetical protein